MANIPYQRSPLTQASEEVDFVPLSQRLSWGAILGGVVLALAIEIVLAMIGAGIGLGTVDVNAGDTPSATTMSIGAGIWWILSICIALYVAGYTAAWLADVEAYFDGAVHGLVIWGLTTLLTIYLLSSAVGAVIGGGFSAIRGMASAAGSGVAAAAKPVAQAAGITPDAIEDPSHLFLGNTDPANMSAQDAQKDIARNLVTYGRNGPDAAAARERIITVMAAQMKISREDAAKRFDEGQAKLRQLKDEAVAKAKTAADESAAAASKAAFAGAGVLVLGGLAGAIGGARAYNARLRAIRTTPIV